MEQRKRFIPEVGQVYENVNGFHYRCLRVSGEEADFVSVPGGWKFTAYGIRKYPDGSIDWDWSSGGRFNDDRI